MAAKETENVELDKKDTKKVVVARSAYDIQRIKLQKLLKNPDKPVFIPEKSEPKLPRVFNPPEFVRNIWGSSAGAGSGDFHVYRGIRRREYARQKFMNIKAKKDELDEDFQKRLAEHKKAAVERVDKKRAKRLKKKQKAKDAKKKKPNQIKPKNDDEKHVSASSPEESGEEDEHSGKNHDDGNEAGGDIVDHVPADGSGADSAVECPDGSRDGCMVEEENASAVAAAAAATENGLAQRTDELSNCDSEDISTAKTAGRRYRKTEQSDSDD